jgi:dimethylhistidine N-methyltransferase
MTITKKTIINYCDHQTASLADCFARDVKEGLTGENKKIPCKYIYDEEGSQIFREIMELPEYYPTHCELEILQSNKELLGSVFSGKNFYLFELGAGDGKKTRVLLDYFQQRGADFRYIPIDICYSAVHRLMEDLNSNFHQLKATGLVSEYFSGLRYLEEIAERIRLVLFLGSSIGNMDPREARAFLKGIHDSLDHGDYFLIGLDLKKDIDVLTRAYNDSAGITERFNKNVLLRINRELGGSFDPDRFVYHSIYEPRYGAVRSYLISTGKQEVYIDAIDCRVRLEKWEAIHTESSYKYDEADIQKMAAQSGFTIKENFRDSRGFFVDSLWRVI